MTPQFGDPRPLQRAILAILPTDPLQAITLRRLVVRVNGFLDTMDVDEREVRRSALALRQAGAVGVLEPTPEARHYRFWRRAA